MATANSRCSTELSVLGPVPVVKGEDPAAYDQLLARVWAQVKPANVIEELWVDDIVDLSSNIQRYRRYKKSLIEAAIPRALEEILTPFMNDASRFGAIPQYVEGYREPTPAMKLVNKWVRCDPKALKEVDRILASGELTMEHVRARAFAMEIDKVRQLENLIAGAETRRNTILREIEYHRATFGRNNQTRSALDAEYEEVSPKTISQKTKKNH